jgi:hypothetical protein
MGDITTTMSDEIMSQVVARIEKLLTERDIYFEIHGDTKFAVKQSNLKDLYQAQMDANAELIEEGVITKEMVAAEMEMLSKNL